MMIRYLADLHFDYDSILAYDNRPFNSAEEMNEALIKNWNHAVTDPNDLTWILGDFCSGDGSRWKELLSQLNGRKALIIGNHDDPQAIEESCGCFEEVAEYREIVDQGRHVVLCHYPILAFHNHYFGWFHLFGHVHSSYEWNIIENAVRLTKNLYVRQDVCQMANVGAMLPSIRYTPRTLDEIFNTDSH